MSREDYLEEVVRLFDFGIISDEAYDAAMENIGVFTTDDEQEQEGDK